MFLGRYVGTNHKRRANALGRRSPRIGRGRGGRHVARNYEELSGLGFVQTGTMPAPNTAGTGGSFMDSIASIFQTAIPAYSQYRLMKTNEGLIKAGRAPIDPASIAPTVRVQAGMDPGAASMMKIAMIGTGALLGGFLLLKVFKR